MAKFNRPEKKSVLKKVKSSSLEAYGGYDPKVQDLTIEFKGGSQYLYKKVPVMTFDGLEGAESKGKFFYANIKGKFETVKIKQGIQKEKKEDVKPEPRPELQSGSRD